MLEQPSQSTTMLSRNTTLDRWEYTQNGIAVLWMSDATFQRYVNAWLETRGFKKPYSEQAIYEAFGHCQALSYWEGCRDPNVYVANPGALIR